MSHDIIRTICSAVMTAEVMGIATLLAFMFVGLT